MAWSGAAAAVGGGAHAGAPSPLSACLDCVVFAVPEFVRWFPPKTCTRAPWLKMPATSEDEQAKRHRLGLAAAQGDADAQCALGCMHRDGQGGPVNFAEARRLLGRAAAQGHAFAQNVLGGMHRGGQGGPVDFSEARRLYGLAAAQGDAEGQ